MRPGAGHNCAPRAHALNPDVGQNLNVALA